MIWSLFSYVLCLVSVFLVLRARGHVVAMAAILSSSLYNIPVLQLGNTASSGIFPVDIVLGAVLFKFYFFKGRTPSVKGRIAGGVLVSALAGYAVLRAMTAITFSDYGYYNAFVLYGAAKWAIYWLALAIFSRGLNQYEVASLFRLISKILIAYFSLAIPHQFGAYDLSGFSAIGHSEVYDVDYLMADVSRAFLGNNAASVGMISFAGVLVGYISSSQGNRRIGLLVASLAALSLLASGSRTDIISALAAFLLAGVFVDRGLLVRAFAFLAVLAIPALLYFSIFDAGSLPYGLSRLLSTEIVGEVVGDESGTFAYRLMNWVIILRYLFDNSITLIFGFGPNGFRMFSVLGVAPMGFGHNVYLHTVGELGLIGLFLLTFWLGRVSLVAYMRRNDADAFGRPLIGALLLLIAQRMISGGSVDSIFAVDNMSVVTIWFLMFLGVALTFHRESMST